MTVIGSVTCETRSLFMQVHILCFLVHLVENGVEVEDAFGFFLQMQPLFLMTHSVLHMGTLTSNTRFSNYKFIGITDTLFHLKVFFSAIC